MIRFLKDLVIVTIGGAAISAVMLVVLVAFTEYCKAVQLG